MMSFRSSSATMRIPSSSGEVHQRGPVPAVHHPRKVRCVARLESWSALLISLSLWLALAGGAQRQGALAQRHCGPGTNAGGAGHAGRAGFLACSFIISWAPPVACAHPRCLPQREASHRQTVLKVYYFDPIDQVTIWVTLGDAILLSIKARPDTAIVLPRALSRWWRHSPTSHATPGWSPSTHLRPLP